MIRTAALVALLAAVLGAMVALLVPNPASAMEMGSGHSAAAAPCDMTGGALDADARWLVSLVGCGAELSPATAQHLLVLRDATCDGETAHVPPARIVEVLTAELSGNRREAVSLFTAASVWCSGRFA